MKFVQYEFEFTYPSLNYTNRKHHIERNNLKKLFMNSIAVKIQEQGLIRFECRVRILIDLCFKRKKRRDVDNYTPKWLLDALVKCEVIKDDNKDIIEEPPNVMIIDNEPEEKMIVRIEAA